MSFHLVGGAGRVAGIAPSCTCMIVVGGAGGGGAALEAACGTRMERTVSICGLPLGVLGKLTTTNGCGPGALNSEA